MHENPWTLIASGYFITQNKNLHILKLSCFCRPSTLETNILYTEKEITEARAHGFADDFEISYERISLGKFLVLSFL